VCIIIRKILISVCHYFQRSQTVTLFNLNISTCSFVLLGPKNNNNNSRVLRHHALNECVSRAFSAAGILVKKEPSGLAHKDGKRPDGCTLIPWHGGIPLGWDVTVCTTVADSYLTAASHTAGAVAEQAADRKCQKYAELSAAYEFQPVAVETHGPLSASTVSFLLDLGRKISERTGEPLEVQFLFQRISILVQRFNSVLFHESFPAEDDTDTWPLQLVFSLCF